MKNNNISSRTYHSSTSANNGFVSVQVDFGFQLVPDAFVVVSADVSPQELNLLDAPRQLFVQILRS